MATTKKYLDSEGLKVLWREIESKFVDTEEFSTGIADLITKDDVTLSYDNGGKKIKLTVDGQEQSIDATPFIKDGMLSDVSITTPKEEGKTIRYDEFDYTVEEYGDVKFIKFLWNTDGGSKEDFLKADDIVITDTKNTEVTSDIVIAGGPLAELVKGVFPGEKITKGTDLQALFTTLFCKEVYPNITKKNGSYTTTVAAPTITASGFTNNKIVEVGTTVTFASITAKEYTTSPTASSVTGFTNEGGGGYSDTIGGEIQKQNVISENWVLSQDEATSYTLTASLAAGFTFDGSKLTNTTVTNAAAASCVLGENSLKAGFGTNTYKVVESPAGAKGSVKEIPAKYIVSNLGNRSEDHKSPVVSAQNDVKKKASDSQSTFSVVGAYPVYHNGNSGGNIAEATVSVLQNATSFEISYGPEGSNFNKFAFPPNHTLSKVEVYNSLSKQYEAYKGGSSTTQEEKTIQSKQYQYNVWTRSGEAYGEGTKFKFTLNKSTIVE